jgi:hypothetical protein
MEDSKSNAPPSEVAQETDATYSPIRDGPHGQFDSSGLSSHLEIDVNGSSKANYK